MGAISSCCKEEEEGSELISALQDEVLSKDDKHDQKLLPFRGCRIQTKFTSKATYESRFVWLNSTTKTIHMSTHDQKDKRHKEASLADVTTVKVTKPSRAKDAIPHVDVCLTVQFQKGGGIDLKFITKEDRDSWKVVLDELVNEAKDVPEDK